MIVLVTSLRRFSYWMAVATLIGLGLVRCGKPRPLTERNGPISLDRVPLQHDDNVRAMFAVSSSVWQEISSLFNEVRDAEAERAAIAQAIARLEQIAGEQTPIHRDDRKNQGAGPGKTDCLDESANSTVFLRLLQQNGLLQHHRVMKRVLRSPLQLDIHWTAVVQDVHTERNWAVDSWYNANGIAPIIQPLEDWLQKKEVPGYYAQ